MDTMERVLKMLVVSMGCVVNIIQLVKSLWLRKYSSISNNCQNLN